MGLDIYLYQYNDFENTRKLETEYNKISDKNWGDLGEYDNLTEAQKETVRIKNKELGLSMGLNEDGSGRGKDYHCIEIPHPTWPDHYFKIGYFRSSYNEGGIERILRNFGLPTLHESFEVKKGDYYIQPDWEKVKENITALIEKLKAVGGYRVMSVSANIFTDPEISSEPEALAAFMKQLAREENKTYNYSNKEGEFFLHEPIKVCAMIPGTNQFLGRERECTYVITESDNTWYINALEIVKATCEYVLGQENINQYYLHWSG